LQNSSSSAFTMAGSVILDGQAVEISGSGRATFGGLTTSSFEGKSAFAKTSLMEGTVTAAANGQTRTVPVSSSQTGYYDSNYLPLGRASAGEYTVVDGVATRPATAKVNDTGVLFNATNYTNSTKTTKTGSETVSWALQPESADTAIAVLLTESKDSSGTSLGASTSKHRITTTGVLTRLSEATTVVVPGSSATVTATITFQ
jgi:hypothetical protein